MYCSKSPLMLPKSYWEVITYIASFVKWLKCELWRLWSIVRHYVVITYIDTINLGNWCLSIKLILECFFIVA